MKKIFIILLILILFPCLLFADVDTKDGTAITTATNIDGFSSNIASVDGQTITGGVSYLYSENFDGSSACGDGSHTNCDNTWDAVGTVVDFNDATGLEGTYSCLIDSSSSYQRIEDSFGDHSTSYAYFMIRYTTLACDAEAAHIYLRNNADSDSAGIIDVASTEKLRCYHGSANAFTDTVLTTGTTYHIWIEISTSSGANDGVLKVWLSENATKPETPEIDISAGTSEIDFGRWDIISQQNTVDFYIDKIRVDDEQIGSNPE